MAGQNAPTQAFLVPPIQPIVPRAPLVPPVIPQDPLEVLQDPPIVP